MQNELRKSKNIKTTQHQHSSKAIAHAVMDVRPYRMQIRVLSTPETHVVENGDLENNENLHTSASERRILTISMPNLRFLRFSSAMKSEVETAH